MIGEGNKKKKKTSGWKLGRERKFDFFYGRTDVK
jgi:hypothetical protein